MSDNEDTPASLGYSEPLSVKNPPDHAIPELNEGLDDGRKVSAPGGCEEIRYVLPHDPGGLSFTDEPVKLPPEFATVVSQSATITSDGVALAWKTAHHRINSIAAVVDPDSMNVSQIQAGPVVVEHLAGELVGLGLPQHSHAQALGSKIETTAAREE
jgi:hypothetical protein